WTTYSVSFSCLLASPHRHPRSPLFPYTTLFRSTVNINGRHVGAQYAHHAAGHVLVAAADHQHAVHPLPLHTGLHAVGDDFARHQRVLHAFRTHGHTV